ncbi:class I adenylate-forming enzyme family protein [Aeromonas hydrophila]|uniref:class I adenylate-forming enzyme family protein n=1 Tax=Aeromonas hydrophila TaxID=644 RepID=UPI00188E1C27|nr:class I adenylate-forming enzyme family protein [Aeromonas hydrophila]
MPDIRTVGEQPLTLEMIERWRTTLIARRVMHGDRLLLLAHPDAASVAIMIAAWHVGAVVCPLPPQTPPDALNMIAHDCGAAFALDCYSETWLEMECEPSPRQFTYHTAPAVTGCDLALIIYSSGSTGAPKGIMLSHNNVLSALRSITSYLQLHDKDIILSVPPLHFDYGLYQVLFGFVVGCQVLLAPPGCNAMQLLKLIKTEQPSVLPLVPALGGGLAKLGNALRQQNDSIRLITNTGGHLPASVVQNLKQVFPKAGVILMYGLTESKRALFLPAELTASKPESVGKPMPGLDAKVFTKEWHDGRQMFRECAPEEVGMLYVRGSSVMQGYTRAENGAGARIINGAYRDDNWLETGDLFRYDLDGDFYFCGREKELIKQAGYCLYPRTLEAVVERHELVIDCAVVGVSDADGDEHACLFVRAEGHLEKHDLLAWLKTHFEHHYLPRRIEVIESWPTNINGKVNKKALCALL